MLTNKKKNIKELPGLGKRVASLETIDGRRMAEDILRHSEKKHRSLVSHIPGVIWTSDKKGRVIFTSQNSKAITGYTPEEEYEMGPEKNWFGRIHPADVESTKTAYKALIEKGDPYNVEYRFKRKDGSWIWLHDRAVATYEEDGMRYADGIASDITERKEAEAEIKRLKEKYESLIRNIPVAIDSCLPDETATMIFISDRYRDWTGYSPQDFYKDPGLWPKTVHPEDRAGAVKAWFGACKNKTEYNDEYRVVHRDTGQVRWVNDHGMPVKDEKGDVIMYDGILMDITERKQMELALADSKEFSSSLLENSPNPIVVINSDKSIKYINPALVGMTAFSEKELLGRKPPYPWWTEETRQKTSTRLQKAMRERMRRTEELFQKKNGERFWVEVSSTPVMSNGQFKYLLISWVDVSEQKQLREDLQHYIREVVMAQEVERKRISRELHDETVQALADLCTDVDVIKMEGKISKKVIRQMDRHRLKIQSIMHDLRRYSYELRPGLLDYFGLIPSLESLAEDWRAEGKINCRIKVVGSEQRLSSEAELLLFRITQEALRNAKKHSDATETVVRIEFTCDKVKLNVSDNGTGFQVPKELASFTRRGKLGLMGMKERANLLGGSFRLQSKSGKGTSVIVEIPSQQVT